MSEVKMNLIELLDYIDPSMLNYQEWVNVGMALKHEGYTVNEWDEWSQRDPGRYHDGEVEKKWNTFQGTNSPVTGATITQLAKENGWHSHYSDDDNSFLDWNDSFIATDVDKGYKLVKTDWVLGKEIKEPTDQNWNPSNEGSNRIISIDEETLAKLIEWKEEAQPPSDEWLIFGSEQAIKPYDIMSLDTSRKWLLTIQDEIDKG